MKKKIRFLGVLLAGVIAFAGFPAVSQPLTVPASAASTTTASTTATKKLAAPKNLKATVSGTTVKLTWKKVSGADAYRVYKLNSKTGKYETLKNVAKTSLTVKNLAAGTYKFKVAALVKNGSKYSVQTKSSAVTAKVKAAEKTASASLPITFPAFGTAKNDVVKTMALTDGCDVGLIRDGVYGYGGMKKINGTECTVMLYFNSDGKFFYGAALIPGSSSKFTALYSDIKAVKGKADINMDTNGVTLYEWVDSKDETLIALIGSESSDGSMFMAMSSKYIPAGLKKSDGADLASLFEIITS